MRAGNPGSTMISLNTPLPAADPDVVRTIRGNFTFVLLHAGNLGFYGAWNTLLTAARIWRSMELVFGVVEMVRQRSDDPIVLLRAQGMVRFVDFFPAAKNFVVLAAADRTSSPCEAGAGRRGRAQQNVRNPGAGKPIVAVARKKRMW